MLATPRPLPRMDFSKGIPPEMSNSLVVVPTMLTSTQTIEELIEALEVRFLANRDDHLHFGLLTDFPDAIEETLPEDEPLVRLAQQRIEELNEKYRGSGRDTFFLFHRPRRYHSRDRIWMGYERKRGKLAEFNRAAARRITRCFALLDGDRGLAGVKYVRHPRHRHAVCPATARASCGRHRAPAQSCRYDVAKRRVLRGYGMLQPRVGV